MFRRSKAANECYNDIEIRLPNGRPVVGKVPTLKRQLYFLTLSEKTARGDGKARLQLFEEFPREVGLEVELNQLTVEEFFDVFNRFFGRRGSIGEIDQPETISQTTESQ